MATPFPDMPYWGTFPVSQSDMGHMGRYTIDAKKGQLIDFRKVSE